MIGLLFILLLSYVAIPFAVGLFFIFLFLGIFSIPVAMIVIILLILKKNERYQNGSYHQATGQPYASVRNSKGSYGEYLTYRELEHFEAYGAKFLFNLYVPKENGEMTEIDLLMVCPSGVFVFESKNYSGWIFGREEQKNWCQTLPAGRGRSKKFYFYNPIMQNRAHVKHLRALLADQIPLHSIIVFSDRCVLKNISITSKDVHVVKRHNLNAVVTEICNRVGTHFLREMDIAAIYERLYPFSQADAMKKERHVENIRSHINE